MAVFHFCVYAFSLADFNFCSRHVQQSEIAWHPSGISHSTWMENLVSLLVDGRSRIPQRRLIVVGIWTDLDDLSDLKSYIRLIIPPWNCSYEPLIVTEIV